MHQLTLPLRRFIELLVRPHVLDGDLEVNADDLRATMRALAKRPIAILYGLRVGYPAAYRLGGRFNG